MAVSAEAADDCQHDGYLVADPSNLDCHPPAGSAGHGCHNQRYAEVLYVRSDPPKVPA